MKSRELPLAIYSQHFVASITPNLGKPGVETVVTLRMVAVLVELVFIITPLILLHNSMNQQISKTLRLSLITALSLSPTLLAFSNVALGIPHMLFLGCLLFALFFILEEQIEIGTLFFSLAMGFDELAVWFGPLFAVISLHKIVNRHLSEGIN